MATYLNLDAHIKPFLGIGQSDDTQDDLLNLLNSQSAARLDSLLNVDGLERATYTDERFDGGVAQIATKNFPVISVTTIKEGKDNAVYTQTAAYLIKRRNIVALDGAIGGGENYEQNKITYVAGYITFDQDDTGGAEEGNGVTFPDDLLHANLLLIAGMYNQRQSHGVKSPNGWRTDSMATDADSVTARTFFPVPNQTAP